MHTIGTASNKGCKKVKGDSIMKEKKICRRWTASEIAVLKENYSNADLADIALLLPGRSRQAIRAKAHYMGLQRSVEATSAWSREEEALLRELFPKEGISCAVRFLPRSWGAVLRKAERMGVANEKDICAGNTAISSSIPATSTRRRCDQAKKWSTAEEAILREYYPTEGVVCATRLPGRTKAMISQHAFSIGLKSGKIWTAEEDEILFRYYPTEKGKCAARLANRSRQQVASRAWYLGLSFKRSRKQ